MDQFSLLLFYLPFSLFGASITYGVTLKIVFWGESPYKSALERFLRALSVSALLSTASVGALAYMTISDPTIVKEALAGQPNSSETISKDLVIVYILMSYGAVFSYTRKKLSKF